MSESASTRTAVTIRARGIVQAVGFRPYVHRLATSLGLDGWVMNSPAGVTIEIEGAPEAVRAFCERLPREAPPLAVIEETEVTSHEPAIH